MRRRSIRGLGEGLPGRSLELARLTEDPCAEVLDASRKLVEGVGALHADALADGEREHLLKVARERLVRRRA